ncbi:MAG: hypothetical protein JXD23_10965 [Spirochaetales bacterium]|nr:hypothetical protein [Spirochaetales bacterium]
MNIKNRLASMSVFFLLITCSCFAQEKQLDILPGTVLVSPIGGLNDPTEFRGFSISLQSGTELTTGANTFGYSSVSLTGRWIPGSSDFGKSISILFGVADWYTPPLSIVYPSEYLTPSEQNAGSSAVGSILAGLSYKIGSRLPSNDDWGKYKSQLLDYEVKIANAPTEIEKNRLIVERNAFIWTKILRPSYKKGILEAGVIARLSTLALETDAEGLDAFESFAVGAGIFDFIEGIHFYKNFQSLQNPTRENDWALTCTLGFFLDLNDVPPVSVLGIVLGAGYYQYPNRSPILPGPPDIAPYTIRIDGTVFLSGFLRDNASRGSGIGLKFQYSVNHPLENQFQLLVIFSSDFLSSIK